MSAILIDKAFSLVITGLADVYGFKWCIQERIQPCITPDNNWRHIIALYLNAEIVTFSQKKTSPDLSSFDWRYNNGDSLNNITD